MVNYREIVLVHVSENTVDNVCRPIYFGLVAYDLEERLCFYLVRKMCSCVSSS